MAGFVVSIIVVGLFAILAIPFLLAGAIVGTLFYLLGHLLLLPLRLLGATVHLGSWVILSFAKLFFLILAGALCLVALALGLYPLLAVALILIGVWLIVTPPACSRGHLVS